ncbi:hypothetical protein [Paenibacillus chitinolyticus]
MSRLDRNKRTREVRFVFSKIGEFRLKNLILWLILLVIQTEGVNGIFTKKFIGAKGIQLHTFYEMEDKGDLWWKGAPT